MNLCSSFGMPHRWAYLGCRLPQMKHGTHALDGWCQEVASGHSLQLLAIEMPIINIVFNVMGNNFVVHTL